MQKEKEHQHLGFSPEELANRSKRKSIKANEDNVSRRKRWPIVSNMTEASNWTVTGDLCQTQRNGRGPHTTVDLAMGRRL